ncbi:MAG: hypothetical protein QNJ40_24775 [Xanthomonadales bacterium]|nr:hypothetical protein [Xanthomonadales bacterium]
MDYRSARTATHVSISDALMAGLFEQDAPAKAISLDNGNDISEPDSMGGQNATRQKPALFRRFLD